MGALSVKRPAKNELRRLGVTPGQNWGELLLRNGIRGGRNS